MGNWKVTTAPAEAVISTADAKAWLRVEHSDDDALIDAIVSAVTAMAQNYLSQSFVTQTITEVFDSWMNAPDAQVLNLTMNPVQSITSISYVDSDGNTQTLSASDYALNNYAKRAKITPAYGITWPTTRLIANPISVIYTAGYGDAEDVPEDIKLALKLMLADAYENRTDSVRQLPTASKYLLDRLNYTFLL